jgi:hypothetical protein
MQDPRTGEESQSDTLPKDPKPLRDGIAIWCQISPTRKATMGNLHEEVCSQHASWTPRNPIRHCSWCELPPGGARPPPHHVLRILSIDPHLRASQLEREAPCYSLMESMVNYAVMVCNSSVYSAQWEQLSVQVLWWESHTTLGLHVPKNCAAYNPSIL